jgi:NTP pyrophosphatase (non-canonical NTP hydrolase)
VSDAFQDGVNAWILHCFGKEIARDSVERNHRFFEEASELVQACGMTREECHQLVDYVFNRSIGKTKQEVGGVMVTLAALCLAQEISMMGCAETELARVWTKVEKIRAKQASKPKLSPLPQ